MAWNYWDESPRYVSVGEKRARAALAAARLARRSKRKLLPVVLAGRKIASTFWGKAWCDNLESYADFAYRLDRGRSYVRQGAVIHLEIEAARVRSHVSGTHLYDVEVSIRPLDALRLLGRGDFGVAALRVTPTALPRHPAAGGAADASSIPNSALRASPSSKDTTESMRSPLPATSDFQRAR